MQYRARSWPRIHAIRLRWLRCFLSILLMDKSILSTGPKRTPRYNCKMLPCVHLDRHSSACKSYLTTSSLISCIRMVAMVAMAANKGMIVQRGLSEWWSEETEYMFQRIERWAAFARGYNRLRSHRWFKDERTTQERQDTSGLAKPSVEGTSRFCNIEQSRRKSHSEENRINCCGTSNYQSNSKLDSNCLDMYRYDHSIYFKTIGDIRSGKINGGLFRDDDENGMSIDNEEYQEVDASSLIDLLADEIMFEEIRDNNRPNNPSICITNERKPNRGMRNVWPIVDLVKLDFNAMENPCVPRSFEREDNRERDETRQWTNNGNVDSKEMNSADIETWQEKEDRSDNQSTDHQRTKKFNSFRRIRRPSWNARKTPIMGENNVV